MEVFSNFEQMNFTKNKSLKNYNTFGLGNKAKYFASFQNIDELIALLTNYSKPLLIIGGGSNILLTQDFDGTVLKNNIQGIQIIKEDKSHCFIKVGAGVPWHEFVLWSLENNLAGIENLSLIPGSCGAAPMQNIGAYGVELKSIFHELQALKIEDGTLHKFNNEDCKFGYRYSIFKGPLKGKFIITDVTFKLNKKHHLNTSYGAIEQELSDLKLEANIYNISKAIINIRQRKLPDPNKIGNCGSFFKNPIISTQQFEKLKKQFPNIVGYPLNSQKTKVAAGWLIDKAGWKGFRKDDIGVHKHQALVLVNYGNGKGHKIWELSEDIKKSIYDMFGVELEREVNII